MPIIKPTGVTVQGAIKVIYVATIADPNAPKMTELSAGTSLDLTGMLYGDGWAPGVETNRVSAPRRLYSKKIRERLGITTESMGNLHYVIAPQAVAASDGKKAYEKLVEGTTGWFVERHGPDAETVDFAIGQFVTSYPIKVGVQPIVGDPNSEEAEFYVDQPVEITGDVVRLKALVA